MKAPTAPVRFLLIIAAGWIAIRAAAWLPWQAVEPVAATQTPPANLPQAGRTEPADVPAFAEARAAPPFRNAIHPHRPAILSPAVHRTLVASAIAPDVSATIPLALIRAAPPIATIATIATGSVSAPSIPGNVSPAPAYFAPVVAPRAAGRLGGSAWLFVRDAGGAPLAPGGTLGGSQAGLRLTYRLNDDARRPLRVAARLHAPLDRPQGAESALGIEWRPIAALPLNILAERRQRIGREGRSDFALTIHGGGEARLLRGRVRVEGYGQAGIVGTQARDLFADGAVIATTRVGPIDLGAGAWGGAQPGAARLDAGPHAGIRIGIGPVSLQARAEWRFRVAGDAAPGSGPALTIAAGF